MSRLQVIYMARNPKDLVVSYYQFHRSLRTMSYRGTFQEFCRRFMNDKRESAVPPPQLTLRLFVAPPSPSLSLISGIRFLVRSRSGVLGASRGFQRALLEIRRHVQGEGAPALAEIFCVDGLCPPPPKELGPFVEQLARFLGVSCDKAQLEGLAESCNQLIEQCSNSEALSVCRGESARRNQTAKAWNLVPR